MSSSHIAFENFTHNRTNVLCCTRLNGASRLFNAFQAPMRYIVGIVLRTY